MVDFEMNQEENGFASENEGAGSDIQTNIETPLISLKNRREQIVNELFIDIKVPRWEDPEVYVRFKPVSAVKLGGAIERRRKQKGDDWSILANADMLVESCIGVYAVIDGNTEEKFSLKAGDAGAQWTKFDPDLATALGIEATRAVDVCMSLYLTEGDMIDTANRLFRWSNIANEEADETF